MMNRQHGFTLIEVLVALVILGIALTAIFRAMIESSRIAIHLQNKTFAHWVALNEIAHLQSQQDSLEYNIPPTGTTNRLGKSWYWKIEETHSNSPYFIEYTIAVSPNKNEKSITALRFFLRKHHE